MRRHSAARDRIVVRPDHLRPRRHVAGRVHERRHSAVVERPPLARLDPCRRSPVGRVRRYRHPAVAAAVCLQGPERVPGKRRVARQRREERPEHAQGRIVRPVPAVLVGDERPPCRAARVPLVAPGRERLRPVGIHERDAGIHAGDQSVPCAREDEMAPVDRAKVRDDRARPLARAVPAVEQVPAEDRRIVLVRDARVPVHVVQERRDVLLDVASDRRIRPERRHVHQRAVRDPDAPPPEVDAAAPARAGVVAHDRRDHSQPVRSRGPERVVDRLERRLVETAELRLDAQRAADGVAHRLAADDARAELPRRRQGVVDLEVRRIPRAGGIGGAVADEPEPLDVRAAETERLSVQEEPRPGPGHERTRAVRRRRRGGGE